MRDIGHIIRINEAAARKYNEKEGKAKRLIEEAINATTDPVVKGKLISALEIL